MTVRLGWPLGTVRNPDGTVTYRTVEQDTDQEIRGGLAMVCEIRPGQLVWDEQIGIPDPLGSTDPDATADLIATALTDIDPRPTDMTVDVQDTPDGRTLRLKVTL